MYVRSSALLLFVALAVSCAQPASSPTSPIASGGALGAAPPVLAATVRFGNDSVGSPFAPNLQHDQSGHGRDNMIPRTVVVDQGATVTFVMGGGVHQVGIFEDGTRPEDVILTGAVNKPGCPPLGYISGTSNPDTFIDVTGAPICDTTQANVVNQTYTFETPGRYLVICMFIPHFNIGMYGWVEVKEA